MIFLSSSGYLLSIRPHWVLRHFKEYTCILHVSKTRKQHRYIFWGY